MKILYTVIIFGLLLIVGYQGVYAQQPLAQQDEVIAKAVEARDRTIANPRATVEEKAAAQYNIGFLYTDKARSLFSTEAGTDLQPYIDASRQAARAFLEVTSIVAPVEKADKKTVIPYVQHSLFQAGQIYYSIGIGVTLQEDLISALAPLTTFISYVDQGIFPASKGLRENTETSLDYLAAANFELGRMQVGLDGEMSEKAVGYFVDAGNVFRDMVRRYPSANDAAYWQYHVGESHYAAQQFEVAITEYEKVRSVNKNHKSAPESLYAISTCAQLLSEAAEKAGSEEIKHHWYNRLFEANEVLVAEYPNSQYTADALINIGNKYYNAGSEHGVEQADRICFYQMAIEHYLQAVDTPGIGNESKSTALNYLTDTANALTFYKYEVATELLNEAKLSRGDAQKSVLESAIAAYSQIIENYPETKYADLGLVQIGEAYMVLADRDDKYFNDALDYFNRLRAKYETTLPVDTKVNQALTYAISQIQAIQSYMRANNLQIRGGALVNSASVDMVLIPAGEFQMGGSDSNTEDDEKPLHYVYLEAFYIDKYEVTNAQYKAFVDANPAWQKDRILSTYHDGNYLKHWKGNNYPIGKGNHPVVYVSWYAAMAYSEWADKRLPTEAEWEKAARGGLRGQKYPWGNSIDPSKANYYRNCTIGTLVGTTTSVGLYAPNAYGLYDMAGNVWEWCLDVYQEDFYAHSPRWNPVSDGTLSDIIPNFTFVASSRVLRGGAWNYSAQFVRCANRFGLTPATTSLGFGFGFRCVKDVKP